jgi:hypothetical protein
VFVSSGSAISAGGSGTVTVAGTGGAGVFGDPGVQVASANSRITSNNGNVTVTGTGGAGTSSGSTGVEVINGGVISAGGVGAVAVSGTGGAGADGSNHGVQIRSANSRVTSAGGPVSVTGTAGGFGASSGNYGVHVQSGGEITAGGSGAVTVTGQAGAATGSSNVGVLVDGTGSRLTSGGGNVSVTGTGGAGTGFNYGVGVQDAGTIAAGGTGTVTARGTGGAGGGTNNHGVWVSDTNSRITSGGGNISVTGTPGTGSTRFGVRLVSSGGIAAAAGANITVVADSLDIQATATINGLGNTVTLRPLTAGTKVDVGGADVLTASPRTLGLTDAELDRVTAGTLVLGGTGAGDLTVSAPITRPAATDVTLATGGRIFLNNPVDTKGGALTLAGAVAVPGGGTLGVAGPGAGPVVIDGDVSSGGTVQIAGAVSVAPGGTLTAGTVDVPTGATLTVNGTVTVTAPVTVAGGGTLKGNGTLVGGFVAEPGATVSIGQSPGALTVDGAVGINSGAVFIAEIAGLVPGTNYDQLTVNGGVDVSNAELRVVLLGGFVPAPGDRFTLIVNDGTDAVVGTFLGYGEGAAVVVNGVTLRITYKGGDGNDVVLFREAVVDPAPTVQEVRAYYGTGANQYVNLLDPANNRVLPWLNITRIAVVFSESVTLGANALSLTGVVTPSYSLGAPSVVGNTATWNLTAPLARDILTVRVNGAAVSDSGGNHAADTAVQFKVLAGDFDGNGVVDSVDMVKVRNAMAAPYDPRADLNGDGKVDLNDVNAIRPRLNTRLPS